MGKYSDDGGVVSSKVPIGIKTSNEHQTKFGLYRGQILKVIYPDDKENTNGGRIEYSVRVGGQTFPNAVSALDGGGIYNYREQILKHVEKSFDKENEEGTYSENLDGAFVYVMFIEGNQNIPVIVGVATHPRKAAYKKIKKEEGAVSVEEFNGIEFSIDKDSNYMVKQLGRKDPEGKVLNEPAKDAFWKMFGATGDFEFNTHGTEGTADLRMKFNKETKKFELYAQDNKIIIDENGIVIEDKNQNKIEMKSNALNITVNGDVKVDASGKADIIAGGKVTVEAGGDADITASGTCKVTGTQIQLNGSSSGITTATSHQNVIDLITGVPVVPSTTVFGDV
jgi:hypothetical protein